MGRYLILSNLTDEGARTLKKNPERIKEVNDELKKMGVNVIEQYAIFGNIDFMNIVETDDDARLAKVVVELASRGSVKTVTYRAIPIDEFIESLK